LVLKYFYFTRKSYIHHLVVNYTKKINTFAVSFPVLEEQWEGGYFALVEFFSHPSCFSL